LSSPPAWSIYIVRCADGTLYTGIARDVARRVAEHNANSKLAASYTRTRRPVVLVYEEAAAGRSAASRREYAIKQLSRQHKEALIATAARVGVPIPKPKIGKSHTRARAGHEST
jgi:putative endonuclease